MLCFVEFSLFCFLKGTDFTTGNMFLFIPVGEEAKGREVQFGGWTAFAPKMDVFLAEKISFPSSSVLVRCGCGSKIGDY